MHAYDANPYLYPKENAYLFPTASASIGYPNPTNAVMDELQNKKVYKKKLGKKIIKKCDKMKCLVKKWIKD